MLLGGTSLVLLWWLAHQTGTSFPFLSYGHYIRQFSVRQSRQLSDILGWQKQDFIGNQQFIYVEHIMDGEQYTNGLKTTIAEYGGEKRSFEVYTNHETKANLSAGVYIADRTAYQFSGRRI